MSVKPGSKMMYIDDDIDKGYMLRLYLGQERSDIVVLCSPNFQQAQAAVEQKVPDLIILNFTSAPIKRGLNGILHFYRQIKTIPALQSIPVLLWRVPNPRAVYKEMQHLGISGYTEYVCSLDELAAARDILLKGGTYYPDIRRT